MGKGGGPAFDFLPTVRGGQRHDDVQAFAACAFHEAFKACLCEPSPDIHRRALDFLERDRKSTRLNSSHSSISYAVFCLKKKNISTQNHLNPAPRQRIQPQLI